MLWGVKSAFTNGTYEALLFDELRAAGREADYARIFGRARALQAFAVVAASLGAAALARYGFGLALAASLISVALAVVSAGLLPPAAKAVETRERDYIALLKQGLVHAASDRNVLAILGFSALVLALGGALEEFWPIFGVHVGVSRQLIAVFVGAQQAVEAVASLTAHRLGRLGRRWFYALFALGGGVLALAAWWFRAPAMALLAVYSGLMRLLDVAFESRLQHAIPSENRATIGSVKGFAAQIGVSSMYMALGPLAEATSYQTAFLSCGAAAILIGLAYLGWSLRNPAPTEEGDREAVEEV